jgi:hypothetical protein
MRFEEMSWSPLPNEEHSVQLDAGAEQEVAV